MTALLLEYLRPLGARVLLLAVLVAVTAGLQLLNPQIIRYFLDTAQAGGPQAMGLLIAAALAYLAVGFAQQGASLLTASVGLKVGWQATNHLRADLLHHCLRLDMPFHKTHTPGELIERIDGDVTALADFFSQFIVRLAGGLLLTAGILLLVYRESPSAGGLLTMYVATVFGALLLVQRLGRRRWLAARQVWAEQSSFVEEFYTGTEDVRGVGAEAHVLAQLDERLADLVRKVRGGRMANALSFAVTNFLYVVGYSLGLALGAWLYLSGEVTIGGAFLLVTYVGMLSGPLEELRIQSQVLQQASAGVIRIEELRRVAPDVQDAVSDGANRRAAMPATDGASAAVPATSPDGAFARRGAGVQFADVAFAYADGVVTGEATPGRVLQNVTFDVAPGRVLGVLGRTGSGKTTLTRLLFRLYDPTAGTIRLDGQPLAAFPLAELRWRIGMVTQDVQLFHASLRDNITFFDPQIVDAQIEAALAQLGLLDWVRHMPAGLDTLLGGGGQGVSAGEAQLLAFTRLLLRDPQLVILDEAASRLDPVTEQRLEGAIDRLLVGRTAIVIAHRLHTLQRADDILILEAGRVVEYGPRTGLAADPNSRFAHLLRSGLAEVLA
jgi:ABC-type multidrug transport system fused ATPase/permease subunit